MNGGISNRNNLVFRVAIRYDVCIALRVPVIIEAITAIALADSKLY